MTLQLTCDPPGPLFPISSNCEMPKITLNAEFSGEPPTTPAPLRYHWTVSLTFTGTTCAHSAGRRTAHPPIDVTTAEPCLTIPFTHIRGGDVSVGVTVQVNGETLSARTSGLRITGTNPSPADLEREVPASPGFRRLMRLESGLRQFRSPACPLFSEDNLGGVGICQVTTPAPTEDQIWSWKANVQAGWQVYLAKQALAKSYPARVRSGGAFQKLAAAFHSHRQASGLPPLTLELPDFSEEQLERDTLRAYNGFAGQLHEFRVCVDAESLPAVTVSGSVATAQWEIITPAERGNLCEQLGIPPCHRGDLHYVEDVLRQAAF